MQIALHFQGKLTWDCFAFVWYAWKTSTQSLKVIIPYILLVYVLQDIGI